MRMLRSALCKSHVLWCCSRMCVTVWICERVFVLVCRWVRSICEGACVDVGGWPLRQLFHFKHAHPNIHTHKHVHTPKRQICNQLPLCQEIRHGPLKCQVTRAHASVHMPTLCRGPKPIWDAGRGGATAWF